MERERHFRHSTDRLWFNSHSESANLASFKQEREVVEAGAGSNLYFQGASRLAKEPELHLVGTDGL